MLTGAFFGAAIPTAVVNMSFDLGAASNSASEEELRELLLAARQRLAEAVHFADAAEAVREQIRTDDGGAAAAEKTELVASLEEVERSVSGQRVVLREKADRLEAKIARLTPHLLPLAKELAAACDEVLLRYCESARDMRWEIMAARARDAPQTDGPVLSNELDLQAFFRTLSSS